MQQEDIKTKVNAILGDQLNVEEKSIRMEANLATDLLADSIDAVDIAMELEREFRINIPDKVWDEMKDYQVGELYNLVGELTNNEES
jgi:acyl carrier protein